MSKKGTDLRLELEGNYGADILSYYLWGKKTPPGPKEGRLIKEKLQSFF